MRYGNREGTRGWLALSQARFRDAPTARPRRHLGPFLRPFHAASVGFSRPALDRPHLLEVCFAQRHRRQRPNTPPAVFRQLLTLSDLVRRSIGRVHSWTTAHAEVERKRTRELARIGATLNQIARWANTFKANAEALEVIAHLVSFQGARSLLNALIELLPLDDRIVAIEDTLELHITHENCVRFEARELGEESVTIRDLVRHALRHRPDHIVVGEVRGAEAADLLQALNTGHGGSLTTIHANNATSALSRLASCAMQAGGLPWEVICRSVVDGISLIVHTSRIAGRRAVEEIQQLHSWRPEDNAWITEPYRNNTRPDAAPFPRSIRPPGTNADHYDRREER